jgi:hypothetical protein
LRSAGGSRVQAHIREAARCLLGVGLALFAGGKAHAVPVVTSPYVIEGQWVAAPLSDAGFARAVSDCAPAMPSSRAAARGEVFKMVPNGWGYTYDNRNFHSVWPLNSIGVPYTALYLYADCLEGVRAR